MTAWQRIGSICTTDSAAGPEKLRQKAMAKSTAIHVFGANFHLVQNRLKVDVTPISINSVKKFWTSLKTKPPTLDFLEYSQLAVLG